MLSARNAFAQEVAQGQKKSYSAPELTRFGAVEEITEENYGHVNNNNTGGV